MMSESSEDLIYFEHKDIVKHFPNRSDSFAVTRLRSIIALNLIHLTYCLRCAKRRVALDGIPHVPIPAPGTGRDGRQEGRRTVKLQSEEKYRNHVEELHDWIPIIRSGWVGCKGVCTDSTFRLATETGWGIETEILYQKRRSRVCRASVSFVLLDWVSHRFGIGGILTNDRRLWFYGRWPRNIALKTQTEKKGYAFALSPRISRFSFSSDFYNQIGIMFNFPHLLPPINQCYYCYRRVQWWVALMRLINT